MMNKITSKIIFAGAVQNSEKYLPSIFRNIENLSKIFSEVGYIFIENDSTDNTKQLIKDWGYGKPNFHLISLEHYPDFFHRYLSLFTNNDGLKGVLYP